MTGKNLLDLNVLIALAESGHVHHHRAHDWLRTSGNCAWGVCPLTEAGFIRITTSPTFRPGPRSVDQAIGLLRQIQTYPGYCYWQIDKSWIELTAPFAARISGHQQVTDAYLLGLAIKEDGVLVTFDKGIRYMAGAEFSRNVCFLG